MTKLAAVHRASLSSASVIGLGVLLTGVVVPPYGLEPLADAVLLALFVLPCAYVVSLVLALIGHAVLESVHVRSLASYRAVGLALGALLAVGLTYRQRTATWPIATGVLFPFAGALAAHRVHGLRVGATQRTAESRMAPN